MSIENKEIETNPISYTGRGFFNNVLYDVTKTTYPNGVIELSIERIDDQPIINWHDLQKIKNEYLGENVVAIEVYPKQSELVDYANIYHLFYVPGFKVPNTFTGEHTVESYSPTNEQKNISYKHYQNLYIRYYDAIHDIDFDLASIEDYAHGEVGEAITKLRGKLKSLKP